MSATDELRALLDDAGVEYYRHEEDEPLRELKEGTDRATSWRLGKASCTVVECEDGTLDVWIDHATPAQAIEATLGRGECHDLAETPDYRDKTDFKCSACGCEYSAIGGFGCDCGDEPDFRFCPNCGRRVVDE